jgi:hypothetical protein
MMAAVFAVQAEDAKPLLVEEGIPLQTNPSSITTTNETSALGYKISTSRDDPKCDTGFDGYLDLAALDIRVSARVPGGNDMAIGPFFTNVGSIDFYGRQYQGIWLTDDGFVIFDAANYGEKPWEPQILPDSEGPNGLAAVLWQDMEIVYDQAANKGVSLAAATDGSLIVIEFDDVRLTNAPNSGYDMEMVMRRKVSDAPGAYEIVYAYDNLRGPLDGPLTIGVENAAGDSGVALVNKGSAEQVISDGLMVCLDAVTGSPPTSTPSGIQASDGTYEDKVMVTWQDVNQATAYNVYRADANGSNEHKLGTAADNLFNDMSAAAGIAYTYRVRACNEFGCSDPSAHDTGWRAGDGFDHAAFIPMAMKN